MNSGTVLGSEGAGTEGAGFGLAQLNGAGKGQQNVAGACFTAFRFGSQGGGGCEAVPFPLCGTAAGVLDDFFFVLSSKLINLSKHKIRLYVDVS